MGDFMTKKKKLTMSEWIKILTFVGSILYGTINLLINFNSKANPESFKNNCPPRERNLEVHFDLKTKF
jgi:hypothetical protein